MSDAPTITWTGQSGEKYQYGSYQIGTSFKNVPGNYIYAKKNSSGYWDACYIGQTESLKDRLGDHEKETCAKRYGATHIHVHSNGNGEAARKAEEKDLILKQQPPCNEQYVD